MRLPWFLLVNPAAGKRRRGLEAVCQALAAARLTVRLLEPGSARDLREAAKGLAGRKAVVAVFGGDGSLNLAAQGLARGRAILAPLPGGTENVICRELGLSLSPVEAALALSRRSRVLSWDLGFLGGRLFLGMAGIGLDAEVCQSATGSWKKGLGRTAFALSALAALARPRTLFEIRSGRKLWTSCWQAVFSNIARYGGGLKFNAKAKPDDGCLDLALIQGGRGLGPLGQSLSFLLRGRAPGLARARLREARIMGPPGLPAQVDGEAFMLDNPRVHTRPKALLILGPGSNPGS